MSYLTWNSVRWYSRQSRQLGTAHNTEISFDFFDQASTSYAVSYKFHCVLKDIMHNSASRSEANPSRPAAKRKDLSSFVSSLILQLIAPPCLSLCI